MKVFIFDLLAYGEQLSHLQVGSELPYPLSSRYFKADVAVRTYAEHLDAWEEMDRLGYDGVGTSGSEEEFVKAPANLTIAEAELPSRNRCRPTAHTIERGAQRFRRIRRT
jgi:hypothetical protein